VERRAFVAHRAVDDDRVPEDQVRQQRPGAADGDEPTHAERDQVLHEDRGERGTDAGLQHGQPTPVDLDLVDGRSAALQLEGADPSGTAGGEALDDLGEEAEHCGVGHPVDRSGMQVGSVDHPRFGEVVFEQRQIHTRILPVPATLHEQLMLDGHHRPRGPIRCRSQREPS
jgi:hypothetical protein